eukprot:1142852-Pelagomonas_calceolata.AAC.8
MSPLKASLCSSHQSGGGELSGEWAPHTYADFQGASSASPQLVLEHPRSTEHRGSRALISRSERVITLRSLLVEKEQNKCPAMALKLPLRCSEDIIAELGKLWWDPQ